MSSSHTKIREYEATTSGCKNFLANHHLLCAFADTCERRHAVREESLIRAAPVLTHMHNSVVPGHVRPRVNLQIVVEQHNRKLLKVKTAHNVANRFFQLDSHSQAQEKLLRLYTSSLRKTTETSTGCSRADAPAAGPLPGCHYSRHGAGRVSTSDSQPPATQPHVPETAELQAGRLRIQQANGQRKRFDITGFCVRARSCASEKARKHSRS